MGERAPGGLALLLGPVVLAAAACSLRRDPPPDASGAQIYEYQNCANCHGERGEGTTRGPALAGLAEVWSADDLADFLAAPEAWLERDARLRAVREAYSGAMSSYDNLTLDERRRLSEHLLGVATPPR